MKSKTSFNIGIILLCLAIIVMLILVGRSAFIAGGRTACYNTDEDYILVEGFKCEEIRRTSELGRFPEIDIDFTDD